MSLEDLENVYLTIGTPSRFKQREQMELLFEESAANSGKPVQPILGEKGIGRLSVMRLGQRLIVTTSRSGEKKWNVLEIDWDRFSQDLDELIDNIEVSPNTGAPKNNAKQSGTTIRISALNSDWTKEKLVQIAKDEFGRLTDPFTPKSRYIITLQFNGELVPIPSFDRLVLQHAHAFVTAKFFFDENDQPILLGKIDYLERKKEKIVEEEGAHLFELSKSTKEGLRRLGLFSVEFYWFNRQLLRYSKDKIPDYQIVLDLQKMWAGGLMLFRDGFRV